MHVAARRQSAPSVLLKSELSVGHGLSELIERNRPVDLGQFPDLLKSKQRVRVDAIVLRSLNVAQTGTSYVGRG